MSKLTELFDVLSKFSKEKGEIINSIKLKKCLYDELNEALTNCPQYKIFGIFFIGIIVESVNMDNMHFNEDFELVGIINGKYVLSRTDDKKEAKWCILNTYDINKK